MQLIFEHNRMKSNRKLVTALFMYSLNENTIVFLEVDIFSVETV